MLASLRIQNLALVEDLTVDLKPGFTVLTGETGAGKSLLVDALALLVGARGDASLVRQGAERAVVEAVVEGTFEAWAAFLDTRGLPPEQPVVLRRELGAQGRSRAWVNGSPCAIGDLREAGRIWRRLASQHDHQALLAEDRHLGMLDEALGISADLSNLAEEVRQADADLHARRRSDAERATRLADLAEALADLEKLAPRAGEWAALRAEREPLRHAAQLEHAFGEAAEAFARALPDLATAHRAWLRAAGILPDAQTDADRMRSTLLEAEDLSALAQDHAIRWGREGAERLERVEARLAAYEKLARRQRCDPEELPTRWADLKEEQRALGDGASSLAELEARLTVCCAAYLRAAGALHRHRIDGVPGLEKAVQARLARLGMPHARLQVRLDLAEDPSSPAEHLGRRVRVSPAGFTRAALWIEPNPGEGFGPLAKLASGGELSRFMLALRGATPAETGAEPRTYVLDEVDAGIGGETALAVGAAVAALAGHHQVLAVTHLAQVAARANHHGLLSKSTRGGRTRTRLDWLDSAARTRELARLLSGHPDRPEALEHARILMGSPA